MICKCLSSFAFKIAKSMSCFTAFYLYEFHFLEGGGQGLHLRHGSQPERVPSIHGTPQLQPWVRKRFARLFGVKIVYAFTCSLFLPFLCIILFYIIGYL